MSDLYTVSDTDSNSNAEDFNIINNSTSFNSFLENEVFVITVPDSGNRLEMTTNNLHNAGFKNIVTFNGVYGLHSNEIKDAEEKLGLTYTYPGITKWQIRLGNHAHKYKMSDGQRGICLSHLLLLQKCIDEDRDYIFIFEDDCILTDNFKEKVNILWKNTPRDFDILYLGNQLKKKDLSPSSICINNLYIDTIPTHTTHCILISKKGAIRLLDLIKNHTFDTNLNEPEYYVIDSCYLLFTYDNLIKIYNWLQFDSSDSKVSVWNERSSGLVYQCCEELCPSKAHINA